MEETDRVDIRASALSVVFKPAGAAHADRFGPRGARLLAFDLDPELLDGFDDDAADLDALQWHHAGPLTPSVVRLVRTTLSGDARNGPAVEEALTETLAAFRAVEPPRDCAPGWLCQVKNRLDDEPEAALSVAALAEEAGVHRVHLARQFRRYVGCSVSTYRRRAQVRAAADRLASSSLSLAAAALDAGFADQPHCCRTFKTVTGLSPGAFRTLVQSAA